MFLMEKPDEQSDPDTWLRYLNTLGLGDFSDTDSDDFRPPPDAQVRRLRRAIPPRVWRSVKSVENEVDAINRLAAALDVWLKEPEKKAEALTKKVIAKASRSTRKKTSRTRRP